MTKKKINSLYIHIPFCKNICPYCDFLRLYKNIAFEDKYVDQLIKDISSLKDYYFKFKTVFIGGGTPSCLSHNNLEILLSAISKIIDSEHEFSIECNPEDIDDDFLLLLKKYGVNRISIGIQTFDSKLLKNIKREYKINFSSLISKVKKYINNINLDFIYGLPDYSKDILEKDLKKVLELDVNHLSFYSLIIDNGSIYYVNKIKEIDQDISREYYDFILDTLRENNYVRYEVSNFAKPGFECKHNMTYWKNEEYVAIGIGASGYEDNIRYTNTKNLNEYIKGINNKSTEIVDNNLLKKYFFITNLRLADGFSLSKYKEIFKEDFEIEYKSEITDLISKKLVTVKNDNFCCTEEGLILLDQVLLILIK